MSQHVAGFEDVIKDRPPMQTGYGIASVMDGALDWAWVDQQLRASRSYWIISTRPDGRPHAIPVWGIWDGVAFRFATDPSSVKARNLRENPSIVVHLESGDDVVILEGLVESERDLATLKTFGEAYDKKYGLLLHAEDIQEGSFVLQPVIVKAWQETDFPTSATRWRFGR